MYHKIVKRLMNWSQVHFRLFSLIYIHYGMSCLSLWTSYLIKTVSFSRINQHQIPFHTIVTIKGTLFTGLWYVFLAYYVHLYQMKYNLNVIIHFFNLCTTAIWCEIFVAIKNPNPRKLRRLPIYWTKSKLTVKGM